MGTFQRESMGTGRGGEREVTGVKGQMVTVDCFSVHWSDSVNDHSFGVDALLHSAKAASFHTFQVLQDICRPRVAVLRWFVPALSVIQRTGIFLSSDVIGSTPLHCSPELGGKLPV